MIKWQHLFKRDCITHFGYTEVRSHNAMLNAFASDALVLWLSKFISIRYLSYIMICITLINSVRHGSGLFASFYATSGITRLISLISFTLLYLNRFEQT